MCFSCKNCNDRKVGCHGSCDKYKKEKEEYDKKKMIIKANKDINNTMLRNYISKNERKNKKRGYYMSLFRHYGC